MVGFGPTQLSKLGEVLTITFPEFFKIQLGFITLTAKKIFHNYLSVIFTPKQDIYFSKKTNSMVY